MTKESALDRLTPRQRRFAEEYMVDFNGRQAAIRAGYSASSAGSVASNYTARPDMQAALRELLDEPRYQQAVNRLKAIAFSNIKDYFQTDGDKVSPIPLAQLSPEKAAALKRYEIKKSTDKLGRPIVSFRIQLHDSLGALCKLGKIRGLFPDNRT